LRPACRTGCPTLKSLLAGDPALLDEHGLLLGCGGFCHPQQSP